MAARRAAGSRISLGAKPARIGRYQLGDRIGQGAMALVYKAHDPQIDRVLAVKVLRPEYRADQEYAARFLREARAAGALAHPNIVTIYDVGEADGAAYIAMELLDGQTLDDVLAGGRPLAPERVIDIGLQLALALSYAHRAGVVHRDIKPSNISLGADGRSVKILDFGIARVREPESDTAQLETRVGQVIGTPRYMSPEQALGRRAEARSDLFSAGAVLYELACGAPAFRADSTGLVAAQIALSGPPPILERVPDLPRGLAYIIEKLMAREPEQRFADGAALAEALRREQDALGAPTAGVEPRAASTAIRLALGLAATSAAVLVAGAAMVSQAQVGAMRRMARASGETTAAFVAGNIAERAADNATLPPAQRDWLPVQAFVTVAAREGAVRRIEIADADGIVRAASDGDEVGKPLAIHDAGPPGSIAFKRPILYAGRPFGTVRLDLDGGPLAAATTVSRLLMAGLAAATLAIVFLATLVAARRIATPARRLQAALEHAAGGRLDFRMSYQRGDPFAGLYETFNRLVAGFEARAAASTVEPDGAEAPMRRADADDGAATRLDAPATDTNACAEPARRAAGGHRTAA